MENFGSAGANLIGAGQRNILSMLTNDNQSFSPQKEFDIVTLRLSTSQNPDTMDRSVGEFIKPEASKVPLVSETVPLMDSLMQFLLVAASKETLHPAVRSAVARAVHVMNKYIELNRESWVFDVAMGELAHLNIIVIIADFLTFSSGPSIQTYVLPPEQSIKRISSANGAQNI